MKIPSPVKIAALVIIPLVISFVVGLLFWNWYVIDQKEIPVEVMVVDDSLLGFNTGTDKLYFGTLTPTGVGERKATLMIAYDSMVVISMQGETASWVQVSDNNFYLPGNTAREIMFRLYVPEDALPGNYTGSAVIKYYRPMPWQ